MANKNEDRIKEVFKFFDMNNDGILNKNEFDEAVKTLGILAESKEIDDFANSNSRITYDIFFQYTNEKLSKSIDKTDLIKAFQFLDPGNKNGYANKADVEKAFLTLGECLKKEDVDKILKNCSDSNGHVDYRALITSLCGK